MTIMTTPQYVFSARVSGTGRWLVNVTFGATPTAEVSEEFRTETEAVEFASSYSVEEYPEVHVVVFRPAPSLLALYQAATAASAAVPAAWAAVSEFRAARSSRCPGYHWGDEDHLGLIPGRDEMNAREGVLLDAHAAAERAEAASHVALMEALRAAPWGAQPDGAFVTRSSTSCASGKHIHVLHAPARGGPLVESWDKGGPPLLIRTREEARDVRARERAQNSMRAAVYAADRRAVGAALAAGAALEWSHGQEGGTIEVPNSDPGDGTGPRFVSARGALRAAGLGPIEAEDTISRWWSETLANGRYRDGIAWGEHAPLVKIGVEVAS